MHRELAHIGTKLSAPLELQGRTSKKPTIEIQTSMGSWDNLLNRTKTYERVVSPKSVTHRATEFNQASRTIHPEHNVMFAYKLSLKEIRLKQNSLKQEK